MPSKLNTALDVPMPPTAPNAIVPARPAPRVPKHDTDDAVAQLVVVQATESTADLVLSIGAKFMPVRVTTAGEESTLYGDAALMTGAAIATTWLGLSLKLRLEAGRPWPLQTVEAEHGARRADNARSTQPRGARNAAARRTNARRRRCRRPAGRAAIRKRKPDCHGDIGRCEARARQRRAGSAGCHVERCSSGKYRS